MNETPKAGSGKRSFELNRSPEENENIKRVNDNSTPEKVKMETNKSAPDIMKEKGAPDFRHS